MPYRFTPFIIDQIYHIYNRSVAKQPIFQHQKDYQRILETMEYYSFRTISLRFSHRNRSSIKEVKYSPGLENSKKLIDLLGFCLMPNHVHLLLREIEEGGITKYMRKIQNSYAKYFNIRNKRSGAVFQSMFRAVRIEDDEQLLHVLRYIHLNPLTSYILRNVEELEEYPYSSFMDYIKKRESNLVETRFINGFYKTPEAIKKFTYDQVEYQRELEKIKHLVFE